jgi:hypothetical protein
MITFALLRVLTAPGHTTLVSGPRRSSSVPFGVLRIAGSIYERHLNAMIG